MAYEGSVALRKPPRRRQGRNDEGKIFNGTRENGKRTRYWESWEVDYTNQWAERFKYPNGSQCKHHSSAPDNRLASPSPFFHDKDTKSHDSLVECCNLKSNCSEYLLPPQWLVEWLCHPKEYLRLCQICPELTFISIMLKAVPSSEEILSPQERLQRRGDLGAWGRWGRLDTGLTSLLPLHAHGLLNSSKVQDAMMQSAA